MMPKIEAMVSLVMTLVTPRMALTSTKIKRTCLSNFPIFLSIKSRIIDGTKIWKILYIKKLWIPIYRKDFSWEGELYSDDFFGFDILVIIRSEVHIYIGFSFLGIPKINHIELQFAYESFDIIGSSFCFFLKVIEIVRVLFQVSYKDFSGLFFP